MVGDSGRRTAFLCLAMVCASAAAFSAEVLLQVEDFEGPWRRQTNIQGYLGTGFCTSNANPNVADTVMTGKAAIVEAGRYAVWVRAYTSENSKRALRVHVNGTPLETTHTGQERRWMWEKAGEIDLQPGDAVVEIRDAENLGHLDTLSGPALLAIAARVEGVRLIDNAVLGTGEGRTGSGQSR